ncbi:MAG: S-layer homology domain-containing protein, partial [Oscillospiraceae bacterium]|nr:S-layer homology domain-containing protein [Oscillospiraceae bacterium]
MKRLISILLTFAMIISFIPAVATAVEEESGVIKYNFLSYGVNGTSTSPARADFVYANTSKYSAPWEYVNSITANNLTAYSYEFCYNWLGTTEYKEPEQGDGGYIFKIKVEESGNYSVVLNHIAQSTSVNAKIFLVPTSTDLNFKSTGTLPANVKKIPDEYYLGYADGYATKRAIRTTSLKYKYIEAGEYYLVVAPHGTNKDYSPYLHPSAKKYLYVFSIDSLVLDPTYKPTVEVSVGCGAINLGESVKADISVTYGGTETGDIPVFESFNPEVAEISADGVVTTKKVGTASFRATVGQTVEEFSVAVVDPDKTVYNYILGGRVLNNLPDDIKNGAPVEEYPNEIYNVNPDLSMPWKLGVIKNKNGFRIYYEGTEGSANFGVTQSSVMADQVNNSFFSYSVYIPKAGIYGLEIEKWVMTDGGKATIYLAPYAPISASTVVPSESGPVRDAHFVGEVDFSGAKNNVVITEPVGVVNVEEKGEYLLVVVPTDAKGNRAPRYNYRRFSLDGENALRTLELSGYETELEYLEETQIDVVAKRLDGYVFDESEVSLSFSSSNEDAVFVNNSGLVRAVGDGNAVITVTASDGVKEIKKEIQITATDNTETTGSKIDLDDSMFVREKAILELFVLKQSGNEILVPFEEITYVAEPSDIVTIADGMITANKEGNVRITASLDFRGESLVAEKEISVVLHNGKTEPTLFTYERRQNAVENAEKYDWAKAEADKYAKAADRIVENLDTFYDNIPGEGVPRGRQVGAPNDPDYNRCRYCGVNNIAKHGGTGWTINVLNRQWQVQCPDCKRIFPSNDFENFYELGRDRQGYFDVNRARQAHHEMFVCESVKAGGECSCEAPTEEYSDAWYEFYGYGLPGGYLYNDLYPELRTEGNEKYNKDPYRKDENGEYYEVDGNRWGVDDGFGYVPGRVYNVGGTEIEERHGYVAMYNSDAWAGIWTYIRNLSYAYAYTGDIKYGRTGAILLDRIADVYPTFTLKQYEKLFFNTHGGSGFGAIQGRINDCDIARFFALGTDAFYPALTDNYVIQYLSEKAEKFGLENKKQSSQDIWENWEERILKTIFVMEKDGRIHGNFGQKQYALAAAAVSLDKEPESSEMLEWIYKSGSISNAGADGGNLASQLIDEIDRDGFGNEAGPNYNFTWITNMMGMADAMEMYKGEKDYSPYSHPKFAKMYDAVTRLVLTESHHAQIGDSGGVATLDYKATDDVMLTGLLNLKDTPYAKSIAQYLYIKNGYSAEGFRYGIMVKNPESAEEDILALVEENPEPVSEMLSGYGFAVLRDGKNHKSSSSATANNNLRDFWIYFGRNSVSHAHRDTLNLGIEAYGLNIAPDLGYPENTGMDPQRMQWVLSTISHNTVVVDEKNQDGDAMHGYPMHYDVTDKVKVMDIDAKEANSQTDTFRRTVVMVKVNDDVSYGVDFFRIIGGNAHTYSFHSQAENAYAVEGLSMVADEVVQDENGNDIVGSYAGADVPYGQDPDTKPEWSYETRYPRGYTWMKNVRRDVSPQSETFAIEFDVQDYRKKLSDGKGIKLRMTQMNNFVPDEVAITGGTVPQKNENQALPKTLDYVLVQRKDAENKLDSLFTTVFEPYRGERYFAAVEPVEVTGNVSGNNMVKAVKATYADGNRTDYIIYATDNTETYTVSDGGEEVFNFRGFVGVYSVNGEGEILFSYVHDGDIIGEINEAAPAYTGIVSGLQKELSSNNYIDVRMECEDVESLAGKYIFVENDRVENAAYQILSATDDTSEAEGLEEGNIRLDIGTVTLIRGHRDIKDTNSGYVYNIKEEQPFSIYRTYVTDAAPVIIPMADNLSGSAGSIITLDVDAESPLGDKKISYIGTSLPRGASIDEETGEFVWKPSSSQVGKNHIAVTVKDEDGRESVVHFYITVYGSTTGGSSGGGGGGGGGATTTTPTEPETPEKNEEETPEVPDTPETAARFVDLGNHAWASDAINALAEAGIIKGTSETTFSPANNITRADFAILLVRAFGLSSDDTENFADVSESDYFAKELAIARNTGIVNGIGDN